jgi:hypothetical protein
LFCPIPHLLGQADENGAGQELTTGVTSQTNPFSSLDKKNERRTMFPLCSREEKAMFRMFVEEAAALASIVLFVGMIAVWAQLIPQL